MACGWLPWAQLWRDEPARGGLRRRNCPTRFVPNDLKLGRRRFVFALKFDPEKMAGLPIRMNYVVRAMSHRRIGEPAYREDLSEPACRMRLRADRQRRLRLHCDPILRDKKAVPLLFRA